MTTAPHSTTPLPKNIQPAAGQPAAADVSHRLPDASGIVPEKDTQKTAVCRVVTRLPFVVRNNEVTLQEFLIF